MHVWTRRALQALYDDWKWSACMYPACSWAFAEARPQPHIRFSGSSIIALDDYSASREISGPSFGIMVQPSEQRKVEHIPSCGHQRWLTILLTRETFVDMFESTLSDLPQFLTAFSAGKADQPFIASAQLTKTLSQTAIAMFSSQLRGSTRRMFFEAKTLELLSIISEQLAAPVTIGCGECEIVDH